MHRNLRKGAAEKPPPEATEDVKFQALKRVIRRSTTRFALTNGRDLFGMPLTR